MEMLLFAGPEAARVYREPIPNDGLSLIRFIDIVIAREPLGRCTV